MMALDNTTKKLEVILGGTITTNQLMVTTTYKDVATQDGSEDAAGVGSNSTLTNSATAVTALAAPTQSVRREIENISIHNADTANATVTVRINVDGTSYTLFKGIMATLYNLVYERGAGWTLYNASGVKQ